jgi:hypothetical protein
MKRLHRASSYCAIPLAASTASVTSSDAVDAIVAT